MKGLLQVHLFPQHGSYPGEEVQPKEAQSYEDCMGNSWLKVDAGARKSCLNLAPHLPIANVDGHSPQQCSRCLAVLSLVLVHSRRRSGQLLDLGSRSRILLHSGKLEGQTIRRFLVRLLSAGISNDDWYRNSAGTHLLVSATARRNQL